MKGESDRFLCQKDDRKVSIVRFTPGAERSRLLAIKAPSWLQTHSLEKQDIHQAIRPMGTNNF